MRNPRRARFVLVILLLAAFTLITIDYRSSSLDGVRSGASTVFGPIERAVSDVTRPIGSWFSSIGHLGSYKHENDALRRENSQLENELHMTQAERDEYAQSLRLLHLAGLAQYKVAPARVISYGGGFTQDSTVAIDIGSADGIKKNETVINGDGLVGRTITVGRTTSTVLLANDPTSTVGVRLVGQRQLEVGIVQGRGVNRPLTLSLYSNTTLPQVGQKVVSFGDASTGFRPFVPSVPIGYVTQVDPLNGGSEPTATVKPYVDFTALDIVAVVTQTPARISPGQLVPKSPTPAPTTTVTVTASPSSHPSHSTPASPGTSSSP
ncbi:MAG TPA: rod shape-determining protein MreC [Mycobacteriales bacterium]|nr:rod shape-determining protein MreC [Mycobacteriales bacterium]